MSADDWLLPMALEGSIVALHPMEVHHRDALVLAASDGYLWQLWYTSVPSEHEIDRYISDALEAQERGEAQPFVVYHRASGKIIGSTRYCHADVKSRRLEIGYTWYAQSYQRTGVNTECKYLLLQHAFEALDCIAVEFRTHWHNQASRKAILRLGAKQDGVLRNHRIDAEGRMRDTVVYSIIASEWPVVDQSLSFRMRR